jgi:hypothetical protein
LSRFGSVTPIVSAPLHWDHSTVADHLVAVIAAAEQDLRLEQAVYGLDTRDEKQIQALLAGRLVDWYEVAREVHYPSTAGRRLTHRQRCDLVLTPKGRPLRLDNKQPTLFDPPNQASADEGLWLEVKTAFQFKEGGVRHRSYGPQWRQAVVEDLRKMEVEPLIEQAGLLLVVFNESEEVLQKDLELFEDVLARKEVLAGFRQVRSVPITERIGHRLCTVALWPTVQRGAAV